MQKPTQPGKAAPKPIDDPLAVLIDKLSEEVEPVAVPPEQDATISPGPRDDIEPAG